MVSDDAGEGATPDHARRDGPFFLCDTGMHHSCTHVEASEALRGPGALEETGIEAGSTNLCPCPCHEDCPLAGLSGARWPGSCTCNGTLRRVEMRHGRGEAPSGPSNILTVLTKGTGEALRKGQARRAARSRGAGRDASEIEEIVAEEWRRRGLKPPRGLVLAREVDLIQRPATIEEQVQAQLRVGRDLVGLPFRLRRFTRGGLDQVIQRVAEELEDDFLIATGEEWVIPVLAEDSADELEDLAAGRTPALLDAVLLGRGEVEVR